MELIQHMLPMSPCILEDWLCQIYNFIFSCFHYRAVAKPKRLYLETDQQLCTGICLPLRMTNLDGSYTAEIPLLDDSLS